MRYARGVYLNSVELRRPKVIRSHMQKRPPEGGRLRILPFPARRSEADGGAGDGLDFRALDAEVAQFTRAHAVEFVDGLTVLAPIVEGTCHVHDDPLSGGSLFGTGPWRRVFR